MKFIKVTALAAAMMTTFGAQAELTAMDDAALEAVTGQKGINITLTNQGGLTTTNILTTDAAYDDLDGTAGTSTAGSLFLTGTEISGTGTGGTMSVTVDVNGTVGSEQLVIGIQNMNVANTKMSIGATSVTLAQAAAGTNVESLLRTSMTFNGKVGIAIDAQ